MAFSAIKRKRCLAEIRARLPKHGLMKSCRMVSDLEMVSTKTLEGWYYEEKKRLEHEARVQEETKQANPKNRYGHRAEKVESPSAPLPLVPDPPKPARLQTDTGLLKCSRCNGQHIEQREGSYFCSFCGPLVFEGFTKDVEIKCQHAYHRKFHWMQ